MTVRLPSQVFHRLKPGHADCHVDEPDSPRPSKSVADDYADVEAGALPQALSNGSRGSIGVLGQDGCAVVSGDVRAVHAGICTDEPMAGF